MIKEQTNTTLTFEDFKTEVLSDYTLAITSRECSLLGRKEVLTGKAKFGIFGDGKEVPQLAMAKAFKNGDFSMLGGVQVKLGSFRVNGRYVIGLANLNDIDDKDRWKSEGFQLSVGIAL